MSKEDKTKTLHIPGQARGSGGHSSTLGEIPTQVLSERSNTIVGQLTIVDGPGKGETRPIFSGSNQIGRAPDMRIQLDFGDQTISRTQHGIIVYDSQAKAHSIIDGGKPNPIIVNGDRLGEQRRLVNGDMIKIGLTTLRFDAF